MYSYGLEEVHLGKQDVLPPNLVSLCVASCDASLTPLLALKSLRKLSLVSLPTLVPRQLGSGTARAAPLSSTKQDQLRLSSRSSCRSACLRVWRSRSRKETACRAIAIAAMQQPQLLQAT